MRHLRSLLLASALVLPLGGPGGAGGDPRGRAGRGAEHRRHRRHRPGPGLRVHLRRAGHQHLRPAGAVRRRGPDGAGARPRQRMDDDPAAKTITFTLRDGAKFHSGNPVRAEDVVFSFARVVKLNLTPAFILTQLGWTPENIAEMVTADGNKVTVKYEGDFSPAFVMNVLASRPASVVDEADGHGERGERRHGQRLDERPFRRLGAVLAAGLPPGGAGAAHRLPRLLQGRAQGRQRHHPPRGGIRDPAAPAAAGRRGHGEEPDPRPDRRPAGGHDQGRGLPAGGGALPLLQPEGRGAAARGGLGGGALPRRLPGDDRHHPQGPDGDPPGVLAQGLPRLARRDPVRLRPGEGEADPRRRRRRRRRSPSPST